MQRLGATIRVLVRETTGQDLLEYAMLAGLIAVVAVAAIGAVGVQIHTTFWELIASSM